MFSFKRSSKPSTSLNSGLGHQSSKVTADSLPPGQSARKEVLNQALADVSTLLGDAFKGYRSNRRAKQAIDEIFKKTEAESAANYDKSMSTIAGPHLNTLTQDQSATTISDDISEAANSVAGTFYSVLEAKKAEVKQKQETDQLYKNKEYTAYFESLRERHAKRVSALQTAETLAKKEWASFVQRYPGQESRVSELLYERGMPRQGVQSVMKSLAGYPSISRAEGSDCESEDRDSQNTIVTTG